MLDRICDYAHKLRILRQIQSNKARRYSRITTFQSAASVIVSSFLTFMGFAGLDKIQTYVGWIVVANKIQVEFVFNLFVFLLFVLVILQLVFRFPEKQSATEKAVVLLTNLINEIDDLL